MILKLTKKEGINMVEFSGVKRFTLAVTEEVKTTLTPLLSEKGSQVIIDLAAIDFIDSSAIGCLISLIKRAKKEGAELKLCNLTKDVAEVIELLHLEMVFDIENNQETALRNFQKR